MNKTKMIALVPAVLAAGLAQASADRIGDASYTIRLHSAASAKSTETVSITKVPLPTLNIWESVGAGIYAATVTTFDKDGVNKGANDQWLMCIDTYQVIDWNKDYKNFTLVTLDEVPFGPIVSGSSTVPTLNNSQINAIEKLWYNYYDKALAAATRSTGADSTPAAGLQLAIWEIANETVTTSPYSLTWGDGGTFAATGNTDAVNAANGYLTGLSSAGLLTPSKHFLAAYKNEKTQDFIFVLTGGVPPVADGGMTCAMLGLGLLGLTGVGRLRMASQG